MKRTLPGTVLALALGMLWPASARAVVPSGFTDELVTGVGSPTGLAFTPDGRLLIATQPGRLRVYQSGALLPTTALDLTGVICANSERGLLSVTVDPEFATNRFIYVYYTFRKTGTTCPTSSLNVVNRVSRFVLQDSNLVSLSSETVLVDNIHSWAGNHNAGDVHFGKDGYLYISVGDGGSDYAGDSGGAGANDAARDTHVLLGKILRVTRDGGIPPTNPWQGTGTARCNVTGSTSVGNRCQETFAWGLRNPFRMAFDPSAVGTRFFINDVGQGAWEEIDEGVAGADYGWNCREGAHANSTTGKCAGTPPSPFRDPIHEYGRSTGCASITGGAFVPTGSWPTAFNGDYMFADYVCGQIFRLEPASPSGYTRTSFATELGGSSAVHMLFGSDGLYYTTYASGGQVRRIVYTGSDNRAPVAGLSANPLSGGAPLLVSFDGSASSDPDSGDLVAAWIWDFGDGTAPVETVSPTTTHTYSVAGTYTAILRVRDLSEALSDPATIIINAGNSAPQATILAPLVTDRFSVGQTMTLQGQATDAEQGTLPASSLSWTILLHHAAHTHPFFGPMTGNNINVTYPSPEDFSAAANSFLEVRLTATDALGATSTVTRDAMPRTVNITFATQPPGLQLSVNGTSLVGPQTVVSWGNYGLNVDVPTQAGFTFGSWSDGGARAHTIVTPATATTYTATLSPSVGLSVNDVAVTEGNSGTTAANFTVTLSGASSQTVTASYTTANSTATSGSDYAATAGTVIFPPGTTSQPVVVNVNGDTTVEGNETFFVNLSSPTNATLTDGQGLGTINNDDTVTPPVGEGVVWTAGAGVSIAGNSLTKTAAIGWGNAGAISSKHLTAGDGSVTVTGESTTHRIFGLSNGDTNRNWDDIDFGLYLNANGLVQIYERGAFRGTFGAFSGGDLLQVAVEGSVVRYRRNGALLFTSPTAPTYPLLVDTSLYTQGGTLANAVISGSWLVPPPPPPPVGEGVVWTSGGGVSIAGSSLTKTAVTGWGNAGAISSKHLTAGDGSVTVTGESTTHRIFGLSNGDANQNWDDIDFGLYLNANGLVQIYERGALRGTFGAFGSGDLLQVAVEGSVVRYRRNGALLFTSPTAPTYPLLVDTSLYTQGATLTNAVISGGWLVPPPPPPPVGEGVVWTAGGGVSIAGSSLTKTAATGWGNAGAISSKSLTSGDGSVTLTGESTTHRIFGLSNGDTNRNWDDIDYGFYLNANGQVQVYERGTLRGSFGAYGSGDLFRVAVEGSVVRYRKNGALLFTSPTAPTYPLLVDTSLYTQGATLANAVIAGAWE